MVLTGGILRTEGSESGSHLPQLLSRGRGYLTIEAIPEAGSPFLHLSEAEARSFSPLVW